MNTETLTIRDRLGNGNHSGHTHGAGMEPIIGLRSGGIENRAYQELKHHIHQTLLDRVDLESMQKLSQAQIRDELRMLVERLLEEEIVVINDTERRNRVVPD